MNCPKCGTENSNDSCWCGKCGNKLIENSISSDLAKQQATIPVYTTHQSKKKSRKRVRGIIRLAIAVVLIVMTFITFINTSYASYSFKELLQLQWIPYIILLIASTGFTVWNVVGFLADLRLAKRTPTLKVLSIISLPLSAVILIGISLIAVYSNYSYEAQSPKGQLIQAGINKDEVETVLADLEKFGLYDFSRESEYVRNRWSTENTFGVYYNDETGLYNLSATDFVLEYSYPDNNVYSFKVDNGRVTEIRGNSSYNGLENIYIVKEGVLTNNSLGKRHLIKEYEKATYEWWGEKSIKNQLKSPSSAEFSWYPSRNVVDDKTGTITIYGAVDAQNSYGGMVREEFSVTMEMYPDEEIKTMDTEEYITCRMSYYFPLPD